MTQLAIRDPSDPAVGRVVLSNDQLTLADYLWKCPALQVLIVIPELVIPGISACGYRWLSLAFTGYHWLSLAIAGYRYRLRFQGYRPPHVGCRFTMVI